MENIHWTQLSDRRFYVDISSKRYSKQKHINLSTSDGVTMMRGRNTPLVLVAAPADAVYSSLRMKDPSMKLASAQFSSWWSPELESCRKQAEWCGVDVYFGGVNFLRTLLPQLPKLRWIQTVEAGTEVIMTLKREGMIPDDVIVTRNGETFKAHVSQYVVGQILSSVMKFPQHQRNQELNQWDSSAVTEGCKPLSSCTVSILGLGSVGTEIGRACKYWGMTVWGLTRSKVKDERRKEYVDHIRQRSDLDELLSQCDFLVNVLPSTAETQGLLSGDVLSQCRRKVRLEHRHIIPMFAECKIFGQFREPIASHHLMQALFINVGRGDIIDDDSLVSALRSDWISGAVLDNFNVEPLPESSQLWREKGVVITPHVAHGCNNTESFDQLSDMFIANYRRYVEGRNLTHIVDMDQGY